MTPAFEIEYAGCLCFPLYMSGRAETMPVVAEKLTMVPFLLFLANSLHTENNVVKLTSKNFEIDSNEISNNVPLFSFGETWSFNAKQFTNASILFLLNQFLQIFHQINHVLIVNPI